MHEAFLSCGIDSCIIEIESDGGAALIKELMDDPPEFTLTFNMFSGGPGQPFLCDLVKVPHVSLFVDSAHLYMEALTCRYNISCFVDRSGVDLFRDLGNTNTLFVPHGVDRNLAPDPNLKRIYDVVLPASFIDYEKIRSEWKATYPEKFCRMLDSTLELAQLNPEIPYYRTFFKILEKYCAENPNEDVRKLIPQNALTDIELYLRGKERVDLLKAIKDVKIDIFGSGTKEEWKKYLGERPEVTIHDPVEYEEVLQIMKQSKIVLSSCSWIKYGGHERIFSGFACGAMVVIGENAYLKKFFKEGESIAYYNAKTISGIGETVKKYLADEGLRERVAAEGRRIVMGAHTWRHRAEQLLREVPPLLEKILTDNKA